jgi:hypothetical protein
VSGITIGMAIDVTFGVADRSGLRTDRTGQSRTAGLLSLLYIADLAPERGRRDVACGSEVAASSGSVPSVAAGPLVPGTKATARVDLAVEHEHFHQLFLLDVNVAFVPFELENPASLLVGGGTNVAASGNGGHVNGPRWCRVLPRPDVLRFAIRLLLATQVKDESIMIDRHDLVALVIFRPTRQRVVGLALERGWVTPLSNEIDRHSFVSGMRLAADDHDRHCNREAREGRHRHK